MPRTDARADDEYEIAELEATSHVHNASSAQNAGAVSVVRRSPGRAIGWG